MKQPIKTAPRDGRNILIFFGQDGVSQAKFIPGLPYPWQFIDTNNGVSWLINHAVDGPGGPSHWAPMPEFAPVQPVAVPDGWKLVPLEATRAMIDAASAVEEDGFDAMHKAMLAAAPAAPAAPAAQGDALSDLLDNMLSIEVGPFDVSIVAMEADGGEVLATEPWHKNGPSLKKATVKAIERAIAAKAAS